jgi:hypothetical protein
MRFTVRVHSTHILYLNPSKETIYQKHKLKLQYILYLGYFSKFSVIRNIYNKNTKGPTLMELFTATEKQKKFFWQLEMFD